MSRLPRPAYRGLEPYAPVRPPTPVDLSDNTNRWGAHPAALRVIAAAGSEELARYPSARADALRDAVAVRFGVSRDAVTTGCGSDDLLDSTFRAVCEPGAAVAHASPTFSMVEIFARMNGLRTVPVPAGRAAEASEALLEGSPALLYVCRPDNPTGDVRPASWLRRLADAVEGAAPDGPVLLVDEAYIEFADEAAAGFAREAAESRRVVVLRTLSKAYGLAGLRVGFAVGAPDVVREIEKSRGPYKVSRIGEAAAVAALADAEGWISDVVAQVGRERTRLVEALRARGLHPLFSGANFVCVPLAGRAYTAPPQAAAIAAQLRERGVAVRPFPALPEIGEAVRVTIGPRAEMDAFLAALDGVLR